ncbi:MAG: M23 family metallopeptidase [Xanthomonadales bacterium]|nr:M23 family metallopeptidase [Xanthomonadales bacterium]
MIGLLLLVIATASEPSISLQGDLVQGAVVFGRTDPGNSVQLDSQDVRVSPEGLFVLGFDRDASAGARLTVARTDGTSLSRELSIAPRDYAIERVDGLPPAQVTPPPEVLARIRDDSRQVREARARDDARTDFAGGFHWPAMGRISGVYGSQRILNGQPRRPHYGVDVAGPVGTPVYAPAPGLITLAHDDMYYSGGTLIIDHGHHLSSTFLHLSEILVAAGQRVEQGELVGRIGATGRATGPHLDWRMNWKKARVDPELLVEPMPASP